VIATLCHVRVRFGWLLSLVVVGCGLAACTTTASGAHDPKSSAPSSTVQPSTSATATPSPTGPKTTGPGVRPGEKPPVLDAIAKEHSSTGALEFAVYYIKALDWSLATTDPYLLKQISAATCKTCEGYVKALSELAAQGGTVQGGRIRFRSSRLFDGAGDVTADYIVEVTYTQAPLTRVFPTASPSNDSTTPTTYHSHVFVSWGGTSWRIVEEESSQ
jgi:hypothetical protein